MRLRIALMAGGLAAVLGAQGSAWAQTLSDALAAAYTNNPTLLAERARLRQVDELVPQALSNWRPQLQAYGDVGKAYRSTDPGNTDYLTPREVGARIVQPLYRGGRTLAATRGAEHSVLAGRAQLMATEQQVLLDAVSAYVNVLAAEAVLRFEIQNEQRLTRFLEATGDRFSVGEVTRTDVFQAEARLARATADRVQAEGDLDAVRANYRNVIGSEPGALSLPAIPTDLPATLMQTITQADENNPNVIAAEYDERSARDRVDETFGELLPSLELRGEASRFSELAVNGLNTNDLRGTVNLTVPLYQQGAVYSKLRETRQAVAQRLKVLDQTRRDVREEATQAWNDLEAARAQVRAFTTEVRANEVAVEGVEREQAVGTRTVLDVLDTQRDLLDSQRNLVRSRRDELRESYRVLAAVGHLTARDLDLAVDYYNPEKHYDEVRYKWFGGSSSGDISNEPTVTPR